MRLILSDQLNTNHSWFNEQNGNVLYLMMEIRQKSDHIKQHKQKLLGILASMRTFANELTDKGHKLKYMYLNDPENDHNIGWNILKIMEQNNITAFEYQEPDHYDTGVELKQFCDSLDIPAKMVSTEHFLTERNEITTYLKGKKNIRISTYYRYLRKKHNILLYDDGEPYGGKWSYLTDNHNSVRKNEQPPGHLNFHHNLTDIEKTIDASGYECTGTSNAQDFNWPLNRSEALEQLAYFTSKLLPAYGKYQNTMITQSQYLYHSRLSFALNQKMISPREVIDQVCKTYEQKNKTISLPQIEAFIKKILGFREYMRGIYWQHMPEYRHKNHLFAENKLPGFYYTGNTDMNCLKQVVNQNLETAWLHNMQRIAVAGNFTLLAGIHPVEVDNWFSGMFIDASEWIQLPNTHGFSQFADGGLTATIPFAVSARFIKKMSNYCTSCKYNPNKKLSKDACPFNAMYWHFYHRNRKRLSWILRTKNIYDTWDAMEAKTRQAYLKKADAFLASLNQ
ncbi:MAG: cryptochrome/photolyase family protein [Bacteroidales bacterium]